MSWSGGINGTFWVQTNSGNVSLSASANDPAGVCSMQASLSGPENLSATLGNTSPGVTNVGGEIGTEFEYGTNPCWVGQTDSGSWTLPAGLPSGSYVASLQASNPGNYAAQGYSPNGSPTISTTGSVPIDDQTPSVQLLSPTGSSSWTSKTTATVDVSTGPSGLSSLTCTDNGSGDGATLQSSNGDSYVYTVPLSAGSNSLNCAAANGDQNGALVGNSGTQVYQQDSVVPSLTFTRRRLHAGHLDRGAADDPGHRDRRRLGHQRPGLHARREPIARQLRRQRHGRCPWPHAERVRDGARQRRP